MFLNDYSRHAQSADRARRRVQYRGLTPKGDRLWTREEEEICKKYGNDYRTLQKKLPHRTYYALRSRCQLLGLRPRRNLASAREISLLRRLAPTASDNELRAAFPGRTLAQVKSIGRYYGIRRKKRQFPATGYPILDAIRARCFDLNYTMTDLDQLARSKRYFSNGKWIGGGLNYRAIGRAVKALDGELTVRWRDE